MPGVLGRKQEYLVCGSCGFTVKWRKLTRHMKQKHTRELVAKRERVNPIGLGFTLRPASK